MRKVVVSVSLIFLFNACSHSSEILADCFHNFNLSTWHDLDGDRAWGKSESPLEGVEFHINGQFASVLSDYPCISNEDGKCTIRTWTSGECEPRAYKVTAIPPDSYQPTTPASITISLTSIDFSREAQFGFITF